MAHFLRFIGFQSTSNSKTIIKSLTFRPLNSKSHQFLSKPKISIQKRGIIPNNNDGIFLDSAPLPPTIGKPTVDYKNIVWLDCEMTGLEEKDTILEVGCVITDSELNIISPDFNVVIQHSFSDFNTMTRLVLDMHKKNGLLDLAMRSETTLKQADDLLRSFIYKYTMSGCPIAGNSVDVDRRFIRKYLPKANEYIGHRSIDVSTIDELCKR
eukprot:TRINITY_DN6984_c0_g1_i1.p1 TRINITY_DN6984_c0_g1~~TRINITY_DN6984_c0_g1_i1.p1  ORF type:complete len:211 (-),score=38.38 TRINITY_DN6984_c0_g1_i1:377-1009(-)